MTLNPAIDRELTVPTLLFDTVLRATSWRVDYGGKGFNVSRMLQALGAASVALALAAGHSGRFLQEGLTALGIATDFLWVEGETRTNVSIVTANHDRYIKVNEPGPFVPAEVGQALLAKIAALVRPGDWWVLAGSLPPGLPDTIYALIIELVQTAGAYAVLDSSGSALAAGCGARPYLVKPNAAELAQMTGLPTTTPAEIAAAAAAMRRAGAVHVVVSLGKAGAMAFGDDGAWIATSPPVQEQNPIGAGDAMVAGLTWALARGLELAEALRWGVACGAATAALAGTAMGDRALVQSLYPQVVVRAL